MANAKTQQDYFSPPDVTYQYDFPDGVTFIQFRKLKEGDKAYLQDLNSEIEMNQDKKNMKWNTKEGTNRHIILKRAMKSWNLKRSEGNQMVDVPFTIQNQDKLLENLDPDIADAMYKVVVENNEWLSTTKSKKELDASIAELERRKAEVKKKKK